MALSFKGTKTKELHPGMNKRSSGCPKQLYRARNADNYQLTNAFQKTLQVVVTQPCSSSIVHK